LFISSRSLKPYFISIFLSMGMYSSDQPNLGIVCIYFEPFEFGFLFKRGRPHGPDCGRGPRVTGRLSAHAAPCCSQGLPVSCRHPTSTAPRARRASRPWAVAAQPPCRPPPTPLPHLLAAWCHPGPPPPLLHVADPFKMRVTSCAPFPSPPPFSSSSVA
jgi:hypothetical protein